MKAAPLLRAEIGETLLDIVVADITTLDVAAIVNAANRSLLGGGGVDGAIHRAAGPELLEECETLGGCDTGSAKITKGYRLKASHVIHAVGPVWGGGAQNEEALLAGCYRAALDLAAAHRLASIAYPAISTGIYRFPADLAARIAVGTVASEIAAKPRGITRVVFCCFAPRARSITRRRSRNWGWPDRGHARAGRGPGIHDAVSAIENALRIPALWVARQYSWRGEDG